MSAYYYVTACLPMLTDSEQTPPISTAEMLDLCRRFMTLGDYEQIIQTDMNPESGGLEGVAHRYRMWERSLRNDLARLRAAEQNCDIELYVRESEPVFGTGVVATEAMQQTTPLAAETFLNKCRWIKVDELSCGHFFDMEFLSGYRLKLLIQERHAMFNEERGFSAYRDIYSSVLVASEENKG